MSQRRCAFTLVEMLVVLGVLAALMAMGLPLAAVVRAKANRTATEGAVRALAAAMSGHQAKTLTLSEVRPDGTVHLRTLQLWDVNGDGLVDGDPAAENDTLASAQQYPAEVLASGYRGAVLTLNATLPRRLVEPTTQRPLDAWKRPLRIAFSPTAFRADGFGIWSAGPDGRDDAVGGDDIRSWEAQ
jgi:prepilin-type N-terminal cleavage/methylation domain-containing protein